MSDSFARILLEGGMLFLSTATMIGAGIWKLSDLRDELKTLIEENRLNHTSETNLLRVQVGESISAIREKVTQVELYVRDTYVSKVSFNTVLDRILAEIREMGAKIDNRFIRVETEIKNLDRERSQESHR